MAIVTLENIKARQGSKKSSKKPASARPTTDYQEVFNPQKLETNRGQTEDKTRDKVETNRGQTEDKTRDKVETAGVENRQTRDKLETEPRTHLETKWRQTEDKLETTAHVSSTVGLQRKLLFKVYESCIQNQSKLSSPLSIENLSLSSESTISSTKKTLQRLVAKGLLNRENFKSGRGGWTVYSIPKSVFQDLLHLQTRDKVETNRGQTRDKLETEPRTQPRTSVSSSSSGLNFKSTITSDEMWKTLDLSVIEKMGVNHAAIFEARQKFGPFNFVDLEILIDRFTKYVLDPKSGKKISNPRAFFFGLCKQMSTGIEPLSEVQTEADKALEEYLLKAKADKTAREERDREIITFEFENWFQGLSDEERCAIIPPTGLVKEDTPPYLAMFRDYFERTLWPEKKQRIEKGEV